MTRRLTRDYRRCPCDDCGLPTITPRPKPCEWYMVHDELWKQAGMTFGWLCIGCLERRLGRRLGPADFTNAGCNDPATSRMSNRLASRVLGKLLLEQAVLW